MNAEREEKLISTVARMYEIRRAARTIYGQNYDAKIEPVMKFLADYAKHHGISYVAAVPRIIAELGDMGDQERTSTTMQLTAAAVEMSEKP